MNRIKVWYVRWRVIRDMMRVGLTRQEAKEALKQTLLRLEQIKLDKR